MADADPAHPKRRSKKRDAIVDAARHLFCADGYPGTSMDAVAASAGVSKATLYAHFPSKVELFREVLSSFTATYIRISAEVLEAPVEDGLTALARGFLELVLSPQAIGHYRVMIGQGSQFPEMVETFKAAGPEPVIKSVADYLRYQDERGSLRVPDPMLTADLFLHMVKGEAHSHALLSLPYPDAEHDRVIGEVVRIMMAAYAP